MDKKNDQILSLTIKLAEITVITVSQKDTTKTYIEADTARHKKTYHKSTPLPRKQLNEKSQSVFDSRDSECTRLSGENPVRKQQIFPR